MYSLMAVVYVVARVGADGLFQQIDNGSWLCLASSRPAEDWTIKLTMSQKRKKAAKRMRMRSR